jgi:hypothetical protein
MLLLLSSLVEQGAGTGWTVKLLISMLNLIDMPFFSIILIVCILEIKILLDAGTSSILKIRNWILSGWIFFIKINIIIIIRKIFSLPEVIKSITWGKLAWESSLIKNKFYIFNKFLFKKAFSSETTCKILSSNKVIKNGTNINFYQWLVGVTDGDGTFSFGLTKKNTWYLTFKITQSSYNLRLLYFIKSNLGVGKVYVSKDNMAEYSLRDVNKIINNIIPIFDNYSLLTSKYFNYNLFRQAAFILNNNSLSSLQKHKLLTDLKNTIRSDNYISPAWNKINNLISSLEDANSVINKSWLIGFTEAEGSFYIVKKDSKRFAHGFEITQKLDKIVLEGIGKIFGIKVYNKKTYFTVVTTNSPQIIKIISYYFNTMKGMKSLEYRIWARSFNKLKSEQSESDKYNYLNKVQNQMRNIRSIRLDKNFKILIKQDSS